LKRFNRIAIIGVGLIGGSLGLAIRKKGLAKEVVGVCRTKRSLQLAKKMKAIDRGTLSASHAVQGADLVILATPIRTISQLTRTLSDTFQPGAIITDVASTKADLVRAVEKFLPKHVTFVGSHPMAGREVGGVSYATPTLFEGHVCFMTPHKKTSQSAFKRLRQFWRMLGSKVTVVSPQRHDQLTASFSHLPHLVAALLVLHGEKIELSGTGFRDMTRIASSDPRLWQDVVESNQKEILKSLSRFQKRLNHMAKLLKKRKMQAIQHTLRKAKERRRRLVK